MRKLKSQINKILLDKQQKQLVNWRKDIRWINGYMYSKVTTKLTSVGCVTTVDVPWASNLNRRNGLFKDGSTIRQKLRKDWKNE